MSPGWASLPLGWNRAYRGSGAGAHGCWPAGVLVREPSKKQLRWPANLTGFICPAATVSVLASSSQLVACRRAAAVQAVVPLASRRWEVLLAG